MSSTLPHAVLSRRALRLAVQSAARAGGGRADLRADAWGHGLLEVAQVAADTGIREMLVDTTEEVARLHERGIAATTAGEPDMDARMLYGLPDSSGLCTSEPVMRLVGRVLSVKPLRAGEGVSYGYHHRALTDTRIALVGGGYAQGIVRALGGAAAVGFDESLLPIIGRVAMDACVIDIGEVAIAPGDEVTFFGGSGPAAGMLAQWAHATRMCVGELVTVAGLHARREWVA